MPCQTSAVFLHCTCCNICDFVVISLRFLIFILVWVIVPILLGLLLVIDNFLYTWFGSSLFKRNNIVELLVHGPGDLSKMLLLLLLLPQAFLLYGACVVI